MFIDFIPQGLAHMFLGCGGGGKDGRCNKTKKSLIERGIPSSDNQQTTFVPTTFLYERVEWVGQGLGEEREEGKERKKKERRREKIEGEEREDVRAAIKDLGDEGKNECGLS